MDFTINNGLSMIGGNEFTAIEEEIAILDGKVVHKTGNLTESINGQKTFTSNFALNVPTSVTADVALSNKLTIGPTQTINLNNEIFEIAPTYRVQSVPGTTNLYVDGGLTENTNDYIREEAFTDYRVRLATIDKFSIATYDTIITNDTITNNGIFYQNGGSVFSGDITAYADNIQFNDSVGTLKYIQSTIDTELRNDTITNLASSEFRVRSVPGSDKLNITPTTTSIENDSLLVTAPSNVVITAPTNFEVNSGTGQFQLGPTQVNTTFATIKSVFLNAFNAGIAAVGFDYLSIGTSFFTIRHGIVRIIATTEFQVKSIFGGANLLSITPTANTINGLSTTINGTGSVTQPGFINLTATDPGFLGGTSGRITLNAQNFLDLKAGASDYISLSPLSFLTYVNGSQKTNMGLTTTTNTNATINNVATTAFQVQNVAGTNRLIISPTSYSLNSDATCAIFINAGTFLNVLTGTTCSIAAGDSMSISAGSTSLHTSITSSEFKVNAVQKLMMTPTLTTITNTNVDVVSHLNATDYFVGTAASGRELMSYQLSAGRLISTQGISVGLTYNMNFNNNSLTLTTTNICTPNIVAIPVRCCVFFDSGAITGGGTMTAVVKILTSGGTLIATSASMGFTSFSTALNSVAMTPNSTPARNAILQMTITISTTAAITASSKNVYAIVYCQQQ